jgi:hypothetical protein
MSPEEIQALIHELEEDEGITLDLDSADYLAQVLEVNPGVDPVDLFEDLDDQGLLEYEADDDDAEYDDAEYDDDDDAAAEYYDEAELGATEIADEDVRARIAALERQLATGGSDTPTRTLPPTMSSGS